MATSALDRLITAVLRHPAALAVKAFARDRWWAVRGPRLTNPPVPPDLRALLFVCKGNICRSPFAERLMARLSAEGGGAIRCTSAGFGATRDARSPDAAQAAARAFGVSLDDHRAQPLTPELMAAADLVIVNEWEHVERLRRAYPAQAARVFLLPLVDAGTSRGTGYRRFNTADPYGHPVAVFDECYRDIEAGLRALLQSGRAPSPEA